MERFVAPPPAVLICRICKRLKRNHRGPIKHAFDGVPALDIQNPTAAQITEAFEQALRGIDVARLRINSVAVQTQYAIDDDTRLLSARVLVDVSLIFPRSI